MIKLYGEPTYVLKNQCIHASDENVGMSAEEARKNTMTYQVLKTHNQGTDMKNLNIQCDGFYQGTGRQQRICQDQRRCVDFCFIPANR